MIMNSTSKDKKANPNDTGREENPGPANANIDCEMSLVSDRSDWGAAVDEFDEFEGLGYDDNSYYESILAKAPANPYMGDIPATPKSRTSWLKQDDAQPGPSNSEAVYARSDSTSSASSKCLDSDDRDSPISDSDDLDTIARKECRSFFKKIFETPEDAGEYIRFEEVNKRVFKSGFLEVPTEVVSVGNNPISDAFVSKRQKQELDQPPVALEDTTSPIDPISEIEIFGEATMPANHVDRLMGYTEKCCDPEGHSSVEIESRYTQWGNWGACSYNASYAQLQAATPSEVARFIVERIKRYGRGAQDGKLEISSLANLAMNRKLCDEEQICYTVSTSNRFSVLDTLDLEDLAGIDEDELRDLQEVFKSSARVPERSKAVRTGKTMKTKKETPEDKKPFRPVKKTQTPLSKEEKELKAKRRQAALRRIREKLSLAVSSYNISSNAGIFLQNPITPLTQSLIEHSCVDSADPQTALRTDLKNWLLYCRRVNLSKRRTLWGSMRYVLPSYDLSTLSDTCWIRCLAEDGDVETNPGPVNITMDDVMSCKPAEAYTDTTMSDSHPGTLVMLHKFLDHRGEGEMPGREADSVLHQKWAVEDRGRLRHEDVPLPLAETTLYPDTLILINGRCLDRNSAAPVLFFRGDNFFQGAPWKLHDLASKIEEGFVSGAPLSTRMSINWEGHKSSDVLAIVTALKGATNLANGDEWAMKLGLLRTWTDYQPLRGQQYIPLRGQEKEFARWQVLEANPAVGRSYNNSPMPLENCGGIVAGVQTPLGFPFQGVGLAVPGTLDFHLSVTGMDVSRTFILPARWMSRPNHNRELAIMIALMSPWPMCHFGLVAQCRNALDINQRGRAIHYSWFGSFVSLPGETNLRILLPRGIANLTVTNPVPGAAVITANAATGFAPTMGPTPVGAFPAGFALTIRGDDNGVPAVAQPTLVEYLMSWVDDFLTADIKEVAGYLLSKGVFKPEHLEMAMETPAILATRKGTLFARDPRRFFTPTPNHQMAECRAGYSAVNSNPALQTWTIYGDHVPRIGPNDDWLTTPFLARFHGSIPRSDPFVLSCAFVNYVSFDRSSTQLGTFNSEQLLSAQLMLFRHVSLSWQMMYASFGIGYDALDGIVTGNHQFQVLSETIPHFFMSDLMTPGVGRHVVDRLMKNVFNFHLTPGDLGMTIGDFRALPIDWLPAVCDNFYNVRYNSLTPTLYPDPYLHTSADALPRRFTPYIGGRAGEGVHGIVKPDYVPGTQPGNSGPMLTPVIMNKVFIQPYDWPMFNDDEAWNTRVALTNLPNFSLLPVVVGGAVPIGAMPGCQIPTLATWSPGNLSPVPANMANGIYGGTLWVPPVEYVSRHLLTIQVLPPDVDNGTRIQAGQSLGQWWTWVGLRASLGPVTGYRGKGALAPLASGFLSRVKPKGESSGAEVEQANPPSIPSGTDSPA